MTDLEGLARLKLHKGVSDKEIVDDLVREILEYKEIPRKKARELANSVLEEVKISGKSVRDPLLSQLLSYPESGVTMHDFGVGCRGEGDFIVHRMIGKLSSHGGDALILPEAQDDAGAVQSKNEVIVVSVDGTHSRLSEYPFLAGFHVTRASLRDVYVNGARPVALLNDIHLADDGDIGKLFDFVAGINAISQLTGVPVIAGSTLRVGGDMVIGDRMVSCVGAVGVLGDKRGLTARENIQLGDKILMTKGAGGGTICTSAIYSGKFSVVEETLNIDFIRAAKAVLDSKIGVHAMIDVTNGGLRGDANEICKTAGVGLTFYEDGVRSMVNEKVYRMLRGLDIDYLGVSLDSLLLFTPGENVDKTISVVEKNGTEIVEVGEVVDKPKHGVLVRKGKKIKLEPLFRESGYTKIKKVVGEKTPKNINQMKSKLIASYKKSVRKRDRVIKHIKSKC